MSEVLKQAVSLTQAKTLYDDLRQRIESGAGAATLAETQTIIDNYGQEEDEGMVVDATFGSSVGEAWFKTEVDAADIIAAFKAGRNVVVHCIGTEQSLSYSAPDTYLQMAAYQPSVQNYNEGLYFARSGGLTQADGGYGTSNFTMTHIGQDGKLYIDIYVD